MPAKKLNKSEIDELRWAEDSEIFEIVDEGDWDVDCDWQLKALVVRDKRDGKLYSWGMQRSGSPYTDWEYEYDSELIEVERVERVEVVVSYEALK